LIWLPRFGHWQSGSTLSDWFAMKRFLFSICFALVSTCRSESLPEHYAESGELLLVHLSTAPFPHPQRAEGHKYKDQFFSAAEHYTNDTVGIFIPKGFRETSKIDFVVHFHGWNNNVEGVLKRYHLIEQLIASRRNAVLVVPQGPFNASDSFGGKLEDPDGFARSMKDVEATLREKSALKNKAFTTRNIILSGHSGGYQVISSIVEHGGLTDHVKEVWLFDALYARTEKFLAWWDQSRGRLIDIYTEHGGTKDETEKLKETLKHRSTALFSANDTDATPANLRENRMLFLYTDLAHDDVIDKRKAFEQFLTTSCLAER
jgi:hypothetical protein